jgi:ABC-2 type transport system ATP-binding protein
MRDPVIEVVDVSKRFDAVLAVDHVSFSVERGAVCALLGGNGAGKTTLLSMLVGLLLPTSGQISLLGTDMLRQRYRVLERINFSSPYVDLPQRLTVRENLTIYARLYGVRKVGQRLGELEDQLELGDFMARPYGTLSAGQRTRVALAKALLNRPELLLLDEPTASLDPDTADTIRRFLKDYQQLSGATFLMASHNMLEVERMCDDVIVLRRGEIVDRGSPATLLAHYGRDTLEEVFIAVARAPERGPT